MIDITNLQAGYGASQVLFDVNLSIRQGEVAGLLGRNGMGKTTTVRTMMGLLPVRGGEVRVDGRVVNGMAPNRIARLGLGLVPEGRRVFRALTVEENLIATARRGRDGAGWTLEKVYALFPRLAERASNMGDKLSGGEQQMLAIGRALMTSPRLVILDEATEGLAPLIRRSIWDALLRLKQEGQAVLVIDKNVDALRTVADTLSILERGRTVWTGPPDELHRRRELRDRYLGV